MLVEWKRWVFQQLCICVGLSRAHESFSLPCGVPGLPAGRQYKAVLEADPAQAKAFINWGRVVGLRADMARAAGAGAGCLLATGCRPSLGSTRAAPCMPKLSLGLPPLSAGKEAEAGRLFSLAADKFDAALDLEPQNVAALRMGGLAVLDAALCTLGSDPREARSLLKVGEWAVVQQAARMMLIPRAVLVLSVGPQGAAALDVFDRVLHPSFPSEGCDRLPGGCVGAGSAGWRGCCCSGALPCTAGGDEGAAAERLKRCRQPPRGLFI